MYFNNIVVFRQGKIVERGSFGELMEKRQYFSELYNRTAQAGGEPEGPPTPRL